MLEVTVIDGDGAAKAFLGAASRLPDLTPPLREFGTYMMTSSIPRNFREHGRPDRWATARRWGAETADPLFDEGSLLRSIDFETDSSSLSLGSPLRKALLLQYGSAGLPGGVVRPKGHPFLAIPQVGPGALSKSQARSMRPREFAAGAFILMKGPQGPGLYRKSASFTKGAKMAGGGSWAKTVTQLWLFVREVRIPERPFILFQEEDAEVYVEFLVRYLGLLGSAR